MNHKSTEKNPPSERRKRLEERLKNREGTSYEMVRMVEGRKLVLQVLEYLPGGAMTEGEIEIQPNTVESSPGTPMYDELMREHGPLEIGGNHAIRRRLVDDKWVRLPDSVVYINPEEDDI